MALGGRLGLGASRPARRARHMRAMSSIPALISTATARGPFITSSLSTQAHVPATWAMSVTWRLVIGARRRQSCHSLPFLPEHKMDEERRWRDRWRCLGKPSSTVVLTAVWGGVVLHRNICVMFSWEERNTNKHIHGDISGCVVGFLRN